MNLLELLNDSKENFKFEEEKEMIEGGGGEAGGQISQFDNFEEQNKKKSEQP